ncbi:MAG: thiamine pyrophosphate-binding protein [Betaproteobacteria bacterium]|nr:thiamine pyrophosphate-binding protein [Betaproteobacteria bacterium]
MPRMNGHRFFAEAMRGYGVTHLFYVNSIVPPAMQEMDKVGVARVVTHGEKAAAYMADGYARASHRPGICLSQDIGTTNLAAGLRDAHMTGSPVIAITGGQHDQPRYRHAYQNAEDFTAWDGVTKANYSVDTAERFPDLLRQAFRVATSGAPGPVHLQLRGNAGQMLDREAEFDLVIEKRFTQFPAFRPEAEPSAVKAAVAALAQAAKPIIVAGGGAVSSGAGAEIIKLAEVLQIPIATSLHAKAIVPDDHPLAVGVPGSYSRWCANQAIAAADLVFFIGSHTGGQVTNGWQIPKIGTPTIQLDINADELGRNYPNTVSLHGDAKVTLQKLIEAVNGAPRRAEWLEQVRGYVADYWAECEPLRNSDAVPIRPERIGKELEEWLPAGATLVVDTFHAAIWTAQMTRLKAGQRYLRCAGSLGWAFPATIGAKAALPDKPVIGFAGDAGFYYHMAELETAARLRLNMVMVVNNNYSGGVAESAAFERSVNFAKVADSMGCVGFRVERAADTRAALDQALAAGRPAVVEVLGNPAIRAKRGWVPPAVSGE